MTTFAQGVVQLAPTAPISLVVSNDNPSQLSLTTGGSAGAVNSVNGLVGVVTVTPALIGAPGQVASSPAAGQTLVNGTQTLLTWTAPNDGQLHRFNLSMLLHVTSNETGGAITASYTAPDGGLISGVSMYAGGATTGYSGSTLDRVIGAGTTVTVSQSGALTGGAALVWGQIWGF